MREGVGLLRSHAEPPDGSCFARSSGGGAGGQAAKDALGNDVKQAEWLKTHQPGDRSLTQGLKVRGPQDSNPTHCIVSETCN